MPENETVETSSTDGVSRRSMIKGVAWSTPVIAVAVAAPFAAASAKAELVFDTWGSNWKWDNAGNRIGIIVRIQIQNRWIQSGVSAVGVNTTVEFPEGLLPEGAVPVLTGAGWSFTGSEDRKFTFTNSVNVELSKSTPELLITLPIRTYIADSKLAATAKAANAEQIIAPGWGNTIN